MTSGLRRASRIHSERRLLPIDRQTSGSKASSALQRNESMSLKELQPTSRQCDFKSIQRPVRRRRVCAGAHVSGAAIAELAARIAEWMSRSRPAQGLSCERGVDYTVYDVSRAVIRAIKLFDFNMIQPGRDTVSARAQQRADITIDPRV